MKTDKKLVKIALADDHVLLRNALARLIDSFDNCEVVLEVGNGRQLVSELKKDNLPHVILLDLNMPGMDGFETAGWLRDHYPSIHILMLTMYDGDQALIRLLQYGVKGFLKKDIHPEEFHFAINAVVQSGFYYSQQVSGKWPICSAPKPAIPWLWKAPCCHRRNLFFCSWPPAISLIRKLP